MAPRREVRDSDDDSGSDFGDGIGPEEHETEGNAGEPLDVPKRNDVALHKASTDSTDPSFFQRIYDEQQAAAGVQTVIPDMAPPADPSASTWTDVSPPPPPGQKPQTIGHSSLTSVTDPTPASRRSKRTREARPAEVIDLTDLTTPTMETAGGHRSQRATRTYGTRKGGQLSLEKEPAPSSMPPTQDPYAFPEATPPARKKARRGRPAGSGIESSLPDTARPLYVIRSTLTASQKQEYKTVSLSSDAGPDVSDAFALPGQAPGSPQVYRSSAATTIAYPTPSRIGSSRRLAEPADEVDWDGHGGGGGGGAAASPGSDACHQPSSPDVLTDMSAAAASTAKRTRTKVVSSAGLTPSEPDPPRSTRKAKKRKVVQDDGCQEPEPRDIAQKSHEGSQQGIHGDASGRGASLPDPEVTCEAPDLPETQPVDAEPTGTPPAPEKPAARSKGRRKKKASQAEEAASGSSDAAGLDTGAEHAPAPVAAPEPPAKHLRGRPRRSEVMQSPPEPSDEPELQPTDDQGVEPVNETTAPQPLAETSSNSQPKTQPNADAEEGRDGYDSSDDCKENISKSKPPEGLREPAVKDAKATEADQKPAKRAATVPGQPQKVRYRVGLSKRLRIAPLLKSLKKPA